MGEVVREKNWCMLIFVKEFYTRLTLSHLRRKRLHDLVRDDEDLAPVEEVNEEEEQNHPDFDWEEVVDEAALQGESGSDDQFFDAQVDVE
ncbi:hypothetical protein Dimus_022546 [Dionaea muscipula]